MTAHSPLFGRWLLVGVLGLSGALVFTHEVATRRAYDASVSEIDTVSDNMIPSVRHLAEVRKAIRDLFTELVIWEVGPGGANRRSEARWTAIEPHMQAYRALPALPDESALRTQLVGALERLRRAEQDWASAGASGDAVPEHLRRELFVSAEAALGTIDTLVGENVRAADEAADAIVLANARASGLSVVLLVGVLSTFTAAGLIAFYVLRRAELEVTRRLEELDAFTGRVAHDLKSPLHPALLALGLLRRQPLTEGQASQAERIQRNLLRASALVDGLLAFARSGARPASDARTHLDQVMHDLGPTLRQLATEEGASLVIDVEPGLVLSADPVAVASIVDNLGRNALLYLGSSARREVGIVARAGGDQVMIDVVDSGPGIPPDLLKRLFKPFERGSERPGGSGLGLATVKRLVDAHRGTLEVSSRLGLGTTFRVRLRGARSMTTPAADAPVTVKEPSVAAHRHGSR